jgi:hypothetical protein
MRSCTVQHYSLRQEYRYEIFPTAHYTYGEVTRVDNTVQSVEDRALLHDAPHVTVFCL